ncbi:SGNH/GDSL hydrolase family protein [Hahella aquimaris]|uniref:SGNH/GDSL hydrolase family protein n=1 Tax=Hahella sp. HNIBRBA332 TaxID=3015983 RepID=UPI00273BD2AD|nr:SGNH/GDSL hydrolase family protein [Hahella sp. HNIBRBA332]WLQ15042.1 SGNH/GDSL hydrolase family protein [Hahella sp. HNIBRBA332]
MSANTTKPKREILFTLISVMIAVAVGLTGVEFALGYLSKQAAASEKMDPGLLQYDAQLGWRLARSWSGTHEHQDFKVHYQTNPLGLRTPVSTLSADKKVAVVGDSFVFGLGVNDGETFTDLLNGRSPEWRFANFGTPGYSTDQQLLLYRDLVSKFKPSKTLLVVYLGNDLLDNRLAYPLQAIYGKPFFSLNNGELELNNTPVPQTPKPAGYPYTFSSEMTRGLPESAWKSSLRAMQIGQRLLALMDDPEQYRSHFAEKFEPDLQLMQTLVSAMRKEAETVGEGDNAFMVALLPGRSYIAQTRSLPAYYQEFVRSALKQGFEAMGVPVLDVAAELSEQAQQGGEDWYHPNEGHFTPAGHKVVADILWSGLQGRLQ